MIKVLTHYTPNWEYISSITTPILEKYCKIHGYRLSSYKCTPYQQYNGKEKLKHIVNNLNENDIALIMDADAIITNMTIPIEKFLDKDYDLFITKHLGNINAGVFIIKMTKWAHDFINFLLDNIGKEKINCEQDAMQLYMNMNPYDNKIKILSHPSINSFNYNLYPEHINITHKQGNWEEGDFILHLPGVGMDKRAELLRNVKITK